MSLLSKIALVETLVAEIKELIVAPVVPWYENIPKEGIECWVEDIGDLVREERDKAHHDTRTVYGYDSSEHQPFKALMLNRGLAPDNMIGWTYAIPVDADLRLPDGKITL